MEFEHWAPVLNALTSERSSDLCKRDWKNPICKIKMHDNLLVVFQLLAENRILSTVVIDDDGRYKGFVDALDLANFVVDAIDTRSSATAALSEGTRTRLQNTPAAALVHRPAKREVHLACSVYHSLEHMVRSNQKYMALLDLYDKPMAVLTQSMIIRFLHSKLNLFGAFIQQYPLWQLRNYTNVLSIRQTEPAIDAFRLMATRSVEGLAVVDESDRVVDCISVSDLRGLDPRQPNFWKLYDSVTDFKSYVRKAYPFSTPIAALTVRRDDTFGDVIRKMATKKIHRVFVVSDTGRLIDIVTQTDVLNFVLDKIGTSQ